MVAEDVPPGRTMVGEGLQPEGSVCVWGGVRVSECSEEGQGQDESCALGRIVWQ